MSVLVDYVCTDCGSRSETWTSPGVATTRPCPECGGQAMRRFGASLLTAGDRSLRRTGPQPPAQGGCQDHADLPGGCALSPTAARALSARARRDNRALDREFSYQEAAIRAGTLDPARAAVRPSAAHGAGEGGGAGGGSDGRHRP